MKVLFLERDNVTQLSEPDKDGEVYSASFELFPFYEGSKYSCFMGLLNGDGPLRGHFCVVRAVLDKVAERSDWTDVVRIAAEAQRLATEFNKYVRYKAIAVQIPMVSLMDRVSDFSGLFRCWKPHDKRLKRGEFVTIEPFLDGSFWKFDSGICVADMKSSSRHHGPADVGTASSETVPAGSASLAQAFSHFTWHFTKKLIVCDLQGVTNGLFYTFTSPNIHSTDSQFGALDGSSSAIAEFFSTHRCNNICSKWEKCGPTGKPSCGVNLLNNSEYSNCKNRQAEISMERCKSLTTDV